MLFFLCDHRVVLSELGVIEAKNKELYYPRSMKFYLFQNMFGVLRNLMEVVIIIFEGKYEGEMIDF